MAIKYSIGVWRQQPQQKGMDIAAAETISKEEYEKYLAAISTYRSLVERSTYLVLAQNHLKLRAIIDTYSNIGRIGGTTRYINNRDVSLNFMGAFTNWLSMTRLYLESERDFLLRSGGDGNPELDQYTAAAAHAFDTYPGYRCLYNLRDYAQHCGVPLSGLALGQEDGQLSIDFYLSKSELTAARFAWSRHAQQLLESWLEQISIMPLVDEAMNGYQYIEDQILAILLDRCGSVVAALRDGIERAGSQDGNPAVFGLPTGSGGQMSWQSFPDANQSI
jgi:hypothetical protein